MSVSRVKFNEEFTRQAVNFSIKPFFSYLSQGPSARRAGRTRETERKHEVSKILYHILFVVTAKLLGVSGSIRQISHRRKGSKTYVSSFSPSCLMPFFFLFNPCDLQTSNNLSQPSASVNNWSPRNWQCTTFCSTSYNNCYNYLPRSW